MTVIGRGSTPTINLQILDWDPTGSTPRAFVAQGNLCLEYQPRYNSDTNTLSFDMSSVDTISLSSGEPVRIWQEWTTEEDVVISFPVHVIDVEEYLCSVEVDDEDDYSGPEYILSTDTEVVANTAYFEPMYILVIDTYGGSPIEEEWLEFDENLEDFVKSQDTVVDDDKEYYDEKMILVEPEQGDNPTEKEWYVIKPEPVMIGEVEGEPDPEASPYEAVLPVGTENPSALGWLELDELTGYYNQTTDTTVNDQKVYYVSAITPLRDSHDDFYDSANVAEYMAENGFVELVSVEDVPSEVYMPIELVQSDPRNPFALGWYKDVSGSKVQCGSNETTVDANTSYFTKITGELIP